jgi:molybdenum cofactor cytidylyltransferase
VVNGEDPALATLLEQAGLRVTVCPRAAEGMGASLAWGVARSPEADGWLIALADMPWILPETIRAVAAGVSAPHLIAAPTHQERRGHPVAFGRDYGKALMGLSGDEGARRLLASFAAAMVLLPSEDPGVLRDVDVREQIGP